MIELGRNRDSRPPALDMKLRQDSNDYAAYLDMMLMRYRDEGRPSIDPLAWVNPDAPALAKDMHRLELQQLTESKGGIWLGGSDGTRMLEDARRLLVVVTIYKYLEQAKAHGLDLMGMMYKERPSWIDEMLGDYGAWVHPDNIRHRFERIEEARAERLAKQWATELAAMAPGAECLEIGCGSGFFAREVMKNHPTLHWQATDLPRPMPIDGTALDRNAQPWFAPCELGKPLPYNDASQDVVFANNVLHHVAPELLADFLSEAKRVLKPGGKLYVTEEYAPQIAPATLQKSLLGQNGVYGELPDNFSDFIDSVFWPEDRGHQRTPEKWQESLEAAGFKRMREPRIAGTFGTPGLPVMEACLEFQKQS